ncbi:hypothetical protein Tco_1402556 [Tanacetum coccineum]
MGTKVTSSSGSVLEEPEIQKLQMQAKIFKENSLNKLNALKSTTQLLDRQSIWYQQAFARLFGDSFRTFKFQLSQCRNTSRDGFQIPLNREVIEIFRDYTKMTAQTFKETIIQNMNSIEQCIIERASHEQELKMTLKKLSERHCRFNMQGSRGQLKEKTKLETDGRIIQDNSLRWVPTVKIFPLSPNKVDSEPPMVRSFKWSKSKNELTKIADALYNEKQENLRVCSDLAPQRQMVSAENNTSGPNSEFKTTAMNSQSQSQFQSVSLSSQDSYITTKVGITIPPSYINAEDNR